MCMIIDTNVLGQFLSEPQSQDCEPIYRWVGRGGRIIYSSGGQFDREIRGVTKTKLNELARSGSAILVDAGKIQKFEAAVERDGFCKSNDFHILALAKFSGARVLYTRDRNLIEDFRNKAVIDNPRGKIYSGKANRNLLKSSTCRKK